MKSWIGDILPLCFLEERFPRRDNKIHFRYDKLSLSESVIVFFLGHYLHFKFFAVKKKKKKKLLEKTQKVEN